MRLDKLTFRKIVPQDNPIIARVIRKALEEYGAAQPGTVYTDPTTDALYELFQQPGSVYWIVEHNDTVVGGCGLYPTEGLQKGYVELVKLYLSKEMRGKGVGAKLMLKTIESAKEMGYKALYLESIPALNHAVTLYEKMGFEKTTQRLGDSGHFSCDLWMVKDLE